MDYLGLPELFECEWNAEPTGERREKDQKCSLEQVRKAVCVNAIGMYSASSGVSLEILNGRDGIFRTEF